AFVFRTNRVVPKAVQVDPFFAGQLGAGIIGQGGFGLYIGRPRGGERVVRRLPIARNTRSGDRGGQNRQIDSHELIVQRLGVRMIEQSLERRNRVIHQVGSSDSRLVRGGGGADRGGRGLFTGWTDPDEVLQRADGRRPRHSWPSAARL